MSVVSPREQQVGWIVILSVCVAYFSAAVLVLDGQYFMGSLIAMAAWVLLDVIRDALM